MKRNDLTIWPYGVLMSITFAILPFSHRIVSVELSTCTELDSMYQLYLPNVVELMKGTTVFAHLPSTSMTIGQVSLQLHGVTVALLLLIIYDIIKYKHGRVPFWCMLPVVAFAFHPARAAVLSDACGWPHTTALSFITMGSLAYMRDLCRIGECYATTPVEDSSVGTGDKAAMETEVRPPCSGWYGAFKAVVVVSSFMVASGLHVAALIVPFLLSIYHFVFHQYSPAGVVNAAADRASIVSRRWVSVGMLLAGAYAAINMALLAKRTVVVDDQDAATADATLSSSLADGAVKSGVDVWFELSYCIYRMAVMLMFPSVLTAGFTTGVSPTTDASAAGAGSAGESGDGVPRSGLFYYAPSGAFEGVSVLVLCSVALTMGVSLLVWGQTLLVVVQQLATNLMRVLFSSHEGGRQRIGEHVLTHTGFTRTCIILTIYLLLCYWQMVIYIVTIPKDDPHYTEMTSRSSALAVFVAYHQSGSSGIDKLLMVWSYIPSSFVSAYLSVLIADAFALPAPSVSASSSSAATEAVQQATATSRTQSGSGSRSGADSTASNRSLASDAPTLSKVARGESMQHQQLHKLSFLRSPRWLQAIIVLLILHLVSITSQYLCILQVQ